MINFLKMVIGENFSSNLIPRAAEPMIMDTVDQAASFDLGGKENGVITPIYFYCAKHISSITKKDGHVLDLGSGSGQFVMFLKRMRPDLKITCIELSDAMISIAQSNLKKGEGHLNGINYIKSDMTIIDHLKLDKVDTITSIFSLHHLPTIDLLAKCFSQVYTISQRDQANVFLFDHSRPYCNATPFLFPEVFSTHAPVAFKNDSRLSLIASFSFDEMIEKLNESKWNEIKSRQSNLVKLFQYHLIFCSKDNQPQDFSYLNTNYRLSLKLYFQYLSLKILL